METGKELFEKFLSEGSAHGTAHKDVWVEVHRPASGTQITVWTSDGRVETKETVSAKRPLVVSRAVHDENGGFKVFVDEHGHKNQWTMDMDTLLDRYDLAKGQDFFVPARSEPQPFVVVTEDVVIPQPSWGDGCVQNVRAGGVITTPGDINNPYNEDYYGIAKEEFESTYKVDSDSF